MEAFILTGKGMGFNTSMTLYLKFDLFNFV